MEVGSVMMFGGDYYCVRCKVRHFRGDRNYYKHYEFKLLKQG